MATEEVEYLKFQFDAEFSEMLTALKTQDLHSSCVSPAAQDCGLLHSSAQKTCSPILPKVRQNKSEQLGSAAEPNEQPEKVVKQKHNSANLMIIDGLCIDLGDYTESENEEESEFMEVDLNSTFSVKTMQRKGLSIMSKALSDATPISPMPKSPLNHVIPSTERNYRLRSFPFRRI